MLPNSPLQANRWGAQEIEEKEVMPELYPYGSRGPVGSHYLAAKHGVRCALAKTKADSFHMTL